MTLSGIWRLSRFVTRFSLIFVSSSIYLLAPESVEKLATVLITWLDISEPSIKSRDCRCKEASSWAASATGGMVCVPAAQEEGTPLFTS